MPLIILFHFLCTQYVSDINISIIRSLRLCCWITTSVLSLSVRCVLEIWCGCIKSPAHNEPRIVRVAGWSLQHGHYSNPAASNLQHTTNRELSVLQAEACNTDTTETQPHQISNTQRTENCPCCRLKLATRTLLKPSRINCPCCKPQPATRTLLKPTRINSPTHNEPRIVRVAGWSLQHGHYSNPAASNLQHTTNRELSVLQAEACNTDTTQTHPHQISNTQRTENCPCCKPQPATRTLLKPTRIKSPTHNEPRIVRVAGWSLQRGHYSNPPASNLQHTTNRELSVLQAEAYNTDTTQTHPHQISNTQRTENCPCCRLQPATRTLLKPSRIKFPAHNEPRIVRVADWSLQHGHYSNPAASNLQHTTNRERNDRCGIATAQSQAPDDGYINVRNRLSTQEVK